jgi:hypothetical protein
LRRVRRLTMGALKRTVPDEVPEAVLAFMPINGAEGLRGFHSYSGF